MPKFMRDSSIVLIEGGVETYLMALYGMTLPSIRQRKVVDCRYAPIMGLLGASIELIVKACVVQAYGHAAMYKDGNVGLGVYRFGNEIIDEMVLFFAAKYDYISIIQYVLNNNVIDSQSLKEQFSTIFSDYYLFQKLYGVDYEKKELEIEELLVKLHIQDKLHIKNGVFSSTNLSTGQRKRLALLVSYLEDKPILLFDEWAADQDPEHRKYFYNKLLPELKKEGKCIIAVTHDDSYFGIADQLIKMEMGQIIKQEKVSGQQISNEILL